MQQICVAHGAPHKRPSNPKEDDVHGEEKGSKHFFKVGRGSVLSLPTGVDAL